MQKRKILIVALILGILIVFRQANQSKTSITHHLTGITMGTIYSIKYIASESSFFQKEIDSILIAFNQSLSTYIPDSEISRFNQKDSIIFDSPLMFSIFSMSQEIYKKSDGAYDPTVGPLVNAWGFGPKKKAILDSAVVDSLLQMVGFNNIQFNATSAFKPTGYFLDFSGSAKGFALDIIANFFHKNEIENFMIEIGGEVRCEGSNNNGIIWKMGIDKPEITQTRGNPFATVFIKDRALATSGNYRNYYKEGHQIISHTISPFTGYPISHSLLSASIFAPNCALADGYATACMVMGLDESIKMIEKLTGIDGFFIYSTKNGEIKSYATAGIKRQIEIL